MQKRKKVLLHTDGAYAKTGFGKAAKALLSELYKTDKYEIYHLCCSMVDGDSAGKLFPWKCIGTLPSDQQKLNELQSDHQKSRMAAYGQFVIDDVIKDVKPDVYIGVQDVWGLAYSVDKPWFQNINSVIWTTLDSLPVLQQAVDIAPKTKNYWIWSDFATKALHKLGHEHVKTIHGPIDPTPYKKLEPHQKMMLRTRNGIPTNAFVTGFVFRNQLRKSVDKLLLGYKMWKEKYKPDRPTYLLLHTSLAEGWNIHSFCEEFEIDKKEVLVTYICKACKQYETRPIDGQDLECKFCKQKAQITTNTRFGVNEDQLNEIYNLMNFYLHCMTSGGQEIPIQEAKLTELITALTNYSCGEQLCVEEAQSIPLDYHEYREFGTQFIKASTKEESICEAFNTVYTMPESEKEKKGKLARKWTLQNFSGRNIAKKIQEFIDSTPDVDYSSFSFTPEEKSPGAEVPNIESNREWVKSLYKNILKMDVDEKDQGLKHWEDRLANDLTRQQVEAYFRQEAQKDNNKNKKVNFEDLLDKDDKERILFVMPDSIGDVYLCTSLFGKIKKLYPNHALYVATNQSNWDVLKGNPHIKKVLPYIQQMDNLLMMEGNRHHNGFFDIAFLPHVTTQRVLTYLHNGKDVTEFEIKDF